MLNCCTGLFSDLNGPFMSARLKFDRIELAGSQLSLTVMALNGRKDHEAAALIPGIITGPPNLAWGVVVGMIVAHLFRWEKLSV